jgi:hypothetical protein
MPVTYALDNERHGLFAAASGPITIDDIRTHLTQEHRSKGLAYRELIEASRATVAFSASDVRATVEILRAYAREGVLGPTAIVVGNDLAYGMIRMLGILLEDICEVRPFRARQEAEQWLAGASTAPSSASNGAA